MAHKPNYSFEKRQKELARKAKKEEKKKNRGAEKESDSPVAGDEGSSDPGSPEEEQP